MFGGIYIYMNKVGVTITSIGVAVGILVGGYTLVNKLPVNGISAGDPIRNDDIKTYLVTDTTYDTSGGEPSVVERYEEITGLDNRIVYDSYTATHKTAGSNGKDNYSRQHTTFTADNLTDEEIEAYINEFTSNGGNVYADDAETEKVEETEEKGNYSSLVVSRVDYDKSETVKQSDNDNAKDRRFAAVLGLAALNGGVATYTGLSSKVKVKKDDSKKSS